MKPTLADTSAGVSIAAAVAANVSLNHVAAAVAILSGLYAIYDRWDRRRRGVTPPDE